MPAPPDATVEVGSAASVVGGAESEAEVAGPAPAADGLDDGDLVAVAEADPLAFAEGVAPPPADVVALEVSRGVLALPREVRGVDELDPVALVGRGAEVVGFGEAVVGFGAVVVGAGTGGAVRGCCPEPKRKPMTLPPGGE